MRRAGSTPGCPRIIQPTMQRSSVKSDGYWVTTFSRRGHPSMQLLNPKVDELFLSFRSL